MKMSNRLEKKKNLLVRQKCIFMPNIFFFVKHWIVLPTQNLTLVAHMDIALCWRVKAYKVGTTYLEITVQ